MECNRGGIGEFLPPVQKRNFGLKIVRLKNNDNFEPDKFWGEARSIRTYGASIRFLAGSSKVPLSERYYINKEDPLYQFCSREENFAQLCWYYFLDDEENIKKRFSDYILVPEELLQDIHDRKLEADLLLAYPMAKGGEKNLEDFYGEAFSREDVKGLIIQILAVILEFYRGGCAHGDIKPANIMVSQIKGKKIFRLVDYGSIHSASSPSNSGTREFYDADLYRKIKEKTEDTLLARVFTDCYALGMTVLAMALGQTPVASGLYNSRCVVGKWPEIKDLWKMIEPNNIENLSIDQLEKIVASNTPIQLPINWTPFEVPLEEKVFIPLSPEYSSPVYGKLYEQVRLFREKSFDPMMLISDIKYNKEIYRQVPEFYHLPLIKDMFENRMIFHAPDDLQSKRRPANFSNYTPRNLSNSRPTKSEVKKLMQFGKKLDRFFSENRFAESLWPGKEDIFWCDGALKMLWRKGYYLDRTVSYETYFRFLATGEAELCDEDWQTLLPHFPELEKYGTPERWAAVLDNPSRHRWAFELTSFREFVIGEAKNLSPEELSKILEYMPELLQETETFLRCFPENIRAGFSGRLWGKFICTNPELLKYMPERIFPFLNRRTWVRILGRYPELIEKCPCINHFTPKEWCSIILQKPELQSFIPENTDFSEQKKRLEKLQNFS